MGFFAAGRGWDWRRVGCLAFACVLMCGATPASSRRVVAASPWEQAQRGRATLEGQAEGTRTRAGYERVLDGYRAIYHANPGDAHAAEAVYSVAEVLAEEGREYADVKMLRAAVGQYEFLRKAYPGSPLRAPALLAEGRIEGEDLGDVAGARERFVGVVRESPRSTAGREARTELARLGEGRGVGAAASTHLGDDERGAKSVPQGLKPGLVAGADGTAEAVPLSKAKTAEIVPLGGAKTDDVVRSSGANTAEVVPPSGAKTAPVGELRTLAQVTGIRHWSTPTYTRVAIDLGEEVTFEAARVPGPDRIYFDLHGARLGTELVGKSFDVTDDGFLKRIRAAQAGTDVTRVVLDVNDVTDYSAFLLPNPYRLIIDIHGAAKGREEKTPVAEAPVAASAVRAANQAANTSGLPAMAPTDGGAEVRPAGTVSPLQENGRASLDAHVSEARHGAPKVVATQKPVPNAVAVVKAGTAGEVAAVSEAPGKVEATPAPTSKPIAALVRPVNLGSDGGRTGRGNENGRASLDAHPSDDRAVVRAGHATGVSPTGVGPGRAAEKTADGETSLVRALGLKVGRIVIDAGHGGHDSGTLGVDGIAEKDVVLDVALRLGKLLHERLGAEIVYTRSDDTFIPLETRTAIANRAQADLFLSIHANSSQDESARGVETYYLNFTSDNAALEVAARENAVGGQSVHQLSDLVKKIALKDKIAESREFAGDVEGSLYAGLEKGNAGLKNRGVKKAPFVVLIGANMPSILAEISFVTNAKDAAQLREPEYRERVAESLYAGVAKYESGLAGSRPATVKRAALQ